MSLASFEGGRPDVLKDREPVPARVLERIARPIRDFEATAVWLPPPLLELAGRLAEVLDDVDGNAAGGRSVVREEEEGRTLCHPECSNVSPEPREIPDELGAEDVAVVREVALEVQGSDVEVLEPYEGGGHVWGITPPRFDFTSPPGQDAARVRRTARPTTDLRR